MLFNQNAIGGGNYLISNSLRFRSAGSQYLSRTPTSNSTSQTTRTYSAWIKRGALASAGRMNLFYQGVSAGTGQLFQIEFINDSIRVYYDGSATYLLTTSAVFRDVSAWYNVVVVSDTTQATASDRTKIYINGTLQTITGTQPTQNYTTVNGTTSINYVGGLATNYLFDGYMTEINFIDGQALTPSSFGETNPLTGVWIAKKYTGTYGTNGFYLPFSNGTSTTTLGNDSSGNANNWTLTNFTRSAGVSDCWMYDVPSGNGSPTATQPSSNYAVMNPLSVFGGTTAFSFQDGNLNVSQGSVSTIAYAIASMQTPTSGKWYWEVTPTSITTNDIWIGIIDTPPTTVTSGNTYYGAYRDSGAIYNLAGSLQTSGTSYVANNVIGVAVDIDAGTVQFYKNNVAQGATPSFTFTAGTAVYPKVSTDNVAGANSIHINFGQRSFAYTPPSGFKALCTANLPTPTIAKGNQYMDALLWTGNGASTRTISGYNFTPDFIWTKNRATPTSGSSNHWLYDTVRGAGSNSLRTLETNTTDAEFDSKGGQGNATAFTSDGITFTNGSTANNNRNENNITYVAWAWDAGSSTVTNTSGSISSQVRANTTAGFSIVTYTGVGGTGTVGHGLGVAPKMVIVKARNASGLNYQWAVQHASLASTQILILNDTGAALTNNSFNNTLPTSTVFSTNGSTGTGENAKTYVAYCFAEVAGFSKFGSYTGNGSADGPFVYTNFQPKFVLMKRTDTVGSWYMLDSARNLYNVTNSYLNANASAAELSNVDFFDFLSNGFKLRTSNGEGNANGGTYIYMAFAENPFSVSNAR